MYYIEEREKRGEEGGDWKKEDFFLQTLSIIPNLIYIQLKFIVFELITLLKVSKK